MAKKPTKTTKAAYHPGGSVPRRRTKGITERDINAASQREADKRNGRRSTGSLTPAQRERQAINSRNRSTGSLTPAQRERQAMLKKLHRNKRERQAVQAINSRNRSTGSLTPAQRERQAINKRERQAVQAINSRNRSTGITMRDIATNRPVGRTRNARAVSPQEMKEAQMRQQARMRQQKRTRNARAVSPQEMKEAQMRQEVMMRQQGRTPRRPGQTTQKRLTPKQLQLKRLQGQKYLQAQKARRTPRRPDQPTPTPRPPRSGGMTLRPELPKRPPNYQPPIKPITVKGPPVRGTPTPKRPPKGPVSTRRRSTNPSRTMTRAEARKSIQQFSQNRLR